MLGENENGEVGDVWGSNHVKFLWLIQRAVWPQSGNTGASIWRAHGDKQVSERPRTEGSKGGKLASFLFRMAVWISVALWNVKQAKRS